MTSLFDVQKLRDEGLKKLLSIPRANNEKLRELLSIQEKPLKISGNYALARKEYISNNLQYS